MLTNKPHRIAVLSLVAMLLALAINSPSYIDAQETPGKPVQTEVRLFKLKYGNAADAARIVSHSFGSPEYGDLVVSHDEPSNTLFVRASREQIPMIEKIIKEIDVLPKQMQIEIKLIRASKTGRTISPEIKGFISKLRSLFTFSSYELVDNMSLIAESGSKMSLSTGGKYKVTCTPRFIDEGKGIIRIEGLEVIKLYQISQGDTSAGGTFLTIKGRNEEGTLNINIPNILAYTMLEQAKQGKDMDFGEPMLVTSLNIKNGDTVVVGGSKIDGDDTALITAITARTTE